MSRPSSIERVMDLPLSEAVGVSTGVRRERREGPRPESLLERAQVDSSCRQIVRRCSRLRRYAETKRFLRDVLDVIPGPVELRCKGVPDASARVGQVSKGEWSIYFGRERGFDLGLIGSSHQYEEERFLRITHIQAGVLERDEGYVFDGHMTMIPEVGQEEVFRAYFGIADDEPHPSYRFSFADDPVFAAEAVREALGRTHRPR